MTIELAPRNKQGLSFSSPLMAGSGAVGFGDAWPPAVTPALFGAVVTAPLSLRGRKGAAQPRLAEITGGYLLAAGEQNPGYRRTLQQYGPLWQRMGVPVVVALATAGREEWVELAQRLEENTPVAGIELHLAEEMSLAEAGSAVTAVRRATTLPLLVKLPVAYAADVAGACGAADALVVGTAPLAAYPAAGGEIVEAPVAGPLAFPFTLRALRSVAARHSGLPLVAAGGIHNLEQVRLCLSLGATAVQVRSLLWTDPAGAARLAEAVRATCTDLRE